MKVGNYVRRKKKKVTHQMRCVTFIFLYGLPPKPRAAIVWSLIINLPARKSCHTWWYSLCLEIAITRQLVSKTIFITIGDKEFFRAMSQSSSAFLLSFPHAPTLHLILPIPSWQRNQSSANASGLFTHCIISKSSSCAWLKTVAAIFFFPDSFSAYYPFSRLSSKKLINSSWY